MSYLASGSESLLDRTAKNIGVGTVAVSLEAQWLSSASCKLRDIARNRLTSQLHKLQERHANWDGYGSEGANKESVFEAIDWLDAMTSMSDVLGTNWSDPHVGLNEDGHALFEWWHGAKKLTIFFVPGAPEYVSSWGPNIETQMEAGHVTEAEFSKLWRWLWTRAN